ncbi:MAG TPA: hypothetical protein VHR66_22795 [Gemmataceae bacterium]|jgi:hypothetical protein|nr:hypothetical protein [Gemmataceae bacterium]
MARTAIFVTLIASTLVGPCLCCCIFTRLSIASPSVATDDAKTTTEGACPHCRVAKTTSDSSELAPLVPSEPKRDCPCCEVRSSVTAIAPSTAIPFAVDVAFVGIISLSSDAVGSAPMGAFDSEYPPGQGTKAFLLDSCHRLRC